MLNDKKEIPVFFSVNNRYAPYLAVAIHSLKKCVDEGKKYYIRVLHSGLEETNVQKLQAMAAEDVFIECVNIAEQVKGLSTASLNYISVEALFRILIPELFPQYDKVLYLDCDIVVKEDVSKLFDMELGDAVLGAVKNVCDEKLENYISEYIKISAEEYFNSGVLLINAVKCRENNIAEKCLELYALNKSKYNLVDQDVLNIVCNGKVKYLPEQWNFEWHYQMCGMLKRYEESYAEAKNNPYIIHYTSDKKPWNYPNMPMADRFWDNARQTSFYEEIMYKNILEQVHQNKEDPGACFRTYLFPYNQIPPRSNIILYAAGAVGKAFYNQMSLSKYCNVILWVDKKFENLKATGMPVDAPSMISKMPYDYLILAVETEKQATEIKEELVQMNIDSSKIIWQNPKL